jgi:pSer/pThr/pTyr-binding forkhead associated (FHA) protein
MPMTHATVSREHAEIWKQDDAIHIRDLGSSNGTFVGGERITEAQVQIGDTVQLGQVILDVVAGSEVDGSRSPDSTLIGAERAGDESGAGELSVGQQQVVQLLLKGMSEKQVASTLTLSQHTIHTHIKQIYKTLGVRSRGELMAKLMKKTQEVKLDRRPISSPHRPDAQARE